MNTNHTSKERVGIYRKYTGDHNNIKDNQRFHFEKVISDDPKQLESEIVKTLNWIVGFGGNPFQIIYKSENEAVVFYNLNPL